ncbi:MAG: ParB/RepB/Spo0J family partition protein [Elusimicrobia bacterium]|nr:ParB/RepB/Spo0J family partition protein [Elusimicrobiota bacterium]
MRKALGRGIEALMPAAPAREKEAAPRPSGEGKDVQRIPIESVKPNRAQPRKNFDPERLSELAQTIREHGLAQPIVVSFDAITNSYELIAGERRLRASQLAGMKTIEAVVRAPRNDKDRLVLALIENIQRDDLNAIETALAYKKLMEEHEVNQTQLAQVVGKSKAAVSNTLRLLDLPEEMQKAVQFERISEGHARALLMVSDPEQRAALFKVVVENQLSVRDAEKLAQRIADGGRIGVKDEKEPAAKPPKPADIRAFEQALENAFGTKVEIRTRGDGKSGRVVIHFFSLDDFDNIIKALRKQ